MLAAVFCPLAYSIQKHSLCPAVCLYRQKEAISVEVLRLLKFSSFILKQCHFLMKTKLGYHSHALNLTSMRNS